MENSNYNTTLLEQNVTFSTLSRILKIFKDSFSNIIIPLFIIEVLFRIPSYILDKNNIGKWNPKTQLAKVEIIANSSYIYVIILAILTVGLILFLSLIKFTYDTTYGKNKNLISYLQESLLKLPKTLLATFMYIVFGLAGFLLLVLPGLYLSISFCMFFAAIAIDNKGPFESLKYSKYILKNSWIYTITIIFLLTFVQGLMFENTFYAISHKISSNVTKELIYLVFSSTSTYISIIAIVFCYHELKLRKIFYKTADEIDSTD